jgi:hypothetical protein
MNDQPTDESGIVDVPTGQQDSNRGRSGRDDCSDALLESINAYMTQLARGHRHDEAKFAALIASFEACGELWATEPFVPRNLAHLCASLPAILINSAHGPDKQTVYDAAAKLDELVLNRVLPWDPAKSSVES